jgi:uncharacterized protein YdaU (DUF1376 family)
VARKQALKPDDFMMFYVGDYIASTTHMSTLEHGAYLLILFHYWRTGSAPPDDAARLARIARLSVTEWDTVSVTVRSFFHPVNLNGEWVLVNSKLERTMWDAYSAMAKTKAASKAGNAAKAAKKQAEVRVAATAAHRLHEAEHPSDAVTEPETDAVTDPVSRSGPQLQRQLDIEKEEEEKISPEPKKGPGQEVVVVSPPVMLFPTNLYETKQEQAGITQAMLDEWIDAYPGVDVWMALKAARAWLMSNKARRKTKNGMARYLNSWLSRAQDDASKKGTGNVRESYGQAKNGRFLNGLARAGDSFDQDDRPAEGETDHRGPGKIGDAS